MCDDVYIPHYYAQSTYNVTGRGQDIKRAKRRHAKQASIHDKPYSISEERPRHIAGRIDALHSRAEKVAALNAVDDKWREWVRFYLNDWREKRGFHRHQKKWR
jgi:hypothetical protein